MIGLKNCFQSVFKNPVFDAEKLPFLHYLKGSISISRILFVIEFTSSFRCLEVDLKAVGALKYQTKTQDVMK